MKERITKLFNTGYSKQWLYGYVTCLLDEKIITLKEIIELNDLIDSLKHKH